MTDRDALLAAVLAEPDADAPRLVFADWLEEHPRGEADVARAAFIRLEIEAEGLPDESEERARLETTAARLFNEFGKTWNADVPTWGEWYDSTLIYQRGFPFELRTTLQKLHYSGGALFRVAPIRSLVVSAVRGATQWNAGLLQEFDGRLPDLGGVRAVALGPPMMLNGSGPDVRHVLQAVTRYPSLRTLGRLSFAGCHLDDESIFPLDRALHRAVFRESLDELDLSDNGIRGAGATTLSVVPSLAAVRRLILTGNPLTPLGRRMLRNHFGDRVVL